MIKNKELIEKIRYSGKILGIVLRGIKKRAIPGVTLLELDKFARESIIESGATPAFLGYKPYGAHVPYPATICASINDVIVHGVPTNYQLRNGDILKVDLGVNWQGGISDAAITIAVGEVSSKALNLMKATEMALYEGIKAARAGNTLGDVGYAIEKTVKKHKFFIADGLTGHGVGEELHEDPVVHNFGKPGRGLILKEDMVLAIEPMTSISTPRIVQLDDDSYATADGSISAHFEHTILIKKGEPEILTQ